jgi:hypothetical protein
MIYYQQEDPMNYDHMRMAGWTAVFDSVPGIQPGMRVAVHSDPNIRIKPGKYGPPVVPDMWHVWTANGQMHWEETQPTDVHHVGHAGNFAEWVAEWSMEVDPEFNINCIVEA